MYASELVDSSRICHTNVYIIFFLTLDFIIYDILNVICFYVDGIGQNKNM